MSLLEDKGKMGFVDRSDSVLDCDDRLPVRDMSDSMSEDREWRGDTKGPEVIGCLDDFPLPREEYRLGARGG